MGKDHKATFVVHVQFHQNAEWQGSIQWVDDEKRQIFRSTLEMINLMDEAVGTDGMESPISWDEKASE